MLQVPNWGAYTSMLEAPVRHERCLDSSGLPEAITFDDKDK